MPRVCQHDGETVKKGDGPDKSEVEWDWYFDTGDEGRLLS